jgi:hypothetical protein
MISLADVILEEQIDQVRALLRVGEPVNTIDEYGFTPLIEAAIADNNDIARMLLDHGADVNLQDATGGTALHWAAENHNITLAKALLDRRANPDVYSFVGQPALVIPLLRQHQDMKKLFLDYGAHLEFAQDFINLKLLGHLFELVGTANIISPRHQWVEVDFEGFVLEFTLAAVTESLAQFKNHFAARELRRYSPWTQIIIDVLDRAARLIKYQQYRTDLKKHRGQIRALIEAEPLIIPVSYEGHAITFVKSGDIFVKCDRREDSRLYDNVFFYRAGRPDKLSVEFISDLMYRKQSGQFINVDLHHILELEPLTELKVAAQISGNCSWANVEACVPVLFFLLLLSNEGSERDISRYKTMALHFFHQWREWNKDRALNLCLQSFQRAGPLQKACKAEILAAILFQSCREDNALDAARIEDILEIFSEKRYRYVLQNYVKSYCYEDQSEEGKRFMHILKQYGFL